MEQASKEKHVTAALLLGGSLLECFLAAGTLGRTAEENFTEEHYHASYELLLCQGGAGFQFANGAAFGYREDTVFLFPPHVRHASILDAGHREKRSSIRFLASRWERGGRSGEMERILTALGQSGCFHLPLDSGMAELLALLGEAAERGRTLETSGLLAALLGRVFQLCRQEGAGDGSALDDACRRKFLVDHYFDQVADSGEEPARMEELCARLHLSPSQLNRFLKETYGVTFKQRTIDVRLAKIKYYLRCTDLTASEVARRMNFPTDSSFSLFFRQHEGLSPTQFRRQRRREQTEWS